MKVTVDRNMFHARFHDYDRDDQFSPAALDVLFDWYTEMEECSDEEFILDVVAICCDWSELSLAGLINDYKYLLPDGDGFAQLLDELHDRTTVIEVPGSNTYLIQTI